MRTLSSILAGISLLLIICLVPQQGQTQVLPPKYLTLELFTNTPCPICGSQNPGLFNRLNNYEGEYHLISFYPGKPYSSCIFYQANIAENTTRYNHYTGDIFGTPTVAINGTDFKNSSGVTNAVLDANTGGTSWLHVDVEETDGATRDVTITLNDVGGSPVTTARLYAVIVEREIMYNAPNGETVHHNVFRKFLTPSAGDEVDLSSSQVVRDYSYEVDAAWNANETYVIAWLSDPATKEIFNSGSRFDPDFITSTPAPEKTLPLALYPNPTTLWVNITMPSGIRSGRVQIHNQQGQRVRTLDIGDVSVYTMQVDDLPAGRYIISLSGPEGLYSGIVEVIR